MNQHIAFMLCMLSCLTGQAQQFEAQTIDDKIAIGYGLAIGDVDGDHKPDILLADKRQFVWYRHGDWKRFVLAENLTENDNVCIAARDIDGDGKVEIAVGAQWNPGETSDTVKSGAVFYLVRPKDPTQRWKAIPLHHEPTTHRMKWAKVNNAYHLVVVPLHGRGNKNGEGDAVKIISYEMPKDPAKPWTYHLVDQSMHLTHNFDVLASPGASESILVAGKEGVMKFDVRMGNGVEWIKTPYISDGRQFGEFRETGGIGAGISPMHGHELAVHDKVTKIVLDANLKEGHALAIDRILGGSTMDIVAGWRQPNADNKFGIKIFTADNTDTTPRWSSYWIDDNGMACEDLVVADLDGDGKTDIIAAGRATHNLKIYWNKTEFTKAAK